MFWGFCSWFNHSFAHRIPADAGSRESQNAIFDFSTFQLLPPFINELRAIGSSPLCRTK
ncbi:MAG: hypothetical protein ACI9D0_002142, partial [Bacteroidia bacterium]